MSTKAEKILGVMWKKGRRRTDHKGPINTLEFIEILPISVNLSKYIKKL